MSSSCGSAGRAAGATTSSARSTTFDQPAGARTHASMKRSTQYARASRATGDGPPRHRRSTYPSRSWSNRERTSPDDHPPRTAGTPALRLGFLTRSVDRTLRRLIGPARGTPTRRPMSRPAAQPAVRTCSTAKAEAHPHSCRAHPRRRAADLLEVRGSTKRSAAASTSPPRARSSPVRRASSRVRAAQLPSSWRTAASTVGSCEP